MGRKQARFNRSDTLRTQRRPATRRTLIAPIKLVRAALSGGPYYVRLRRDRLVVRNASTGARFDDKPIVVLSNGPKRRVVGVGAAATAASSTSINPFQHPRILIADFLVAEALLKYAFHAISPRSWVQPSPIAVCHVVEPLEGGLSQIEARALMEMMEGAGARQSFLWEGRELSDAELRSGAYRAAGT